MLVKNENLSIKCVLEKKWWQIALLFISGCGFPEQSIPDPATTYKEFRIRIQMRIRPHLSGEYYNIVKINLVITPKEESTNCCHF